ncbi:hypothetical protein AB5I41_08850 [Sphingomonas sp. MMS24-JH45]
MTPRGRRRRSGHHVESPSDRRVVLPVQWADTDLVDRAVASAREAWRTSRGRDRPARRGRHPVSLGRSGRRPCRGDRRTGSGGVGAHLPRSWRAT